MWADDLNKVGQATRTRLREPILHILRELATYYEKLVSSKFVLVRDVCTTGFLDKEFNNLQTRRQDSIGRQ